MSGNDRGHDHGRVHAAAQLEQGAAKENEAPIEAVKREPESLRAD